LDKPIRVALCDDHVMVRSGLHRILAEEPGIEVIGEAGTAGEAVELARRARPCVLLMDLGLPGASGLAATSQVRQASPGTFVLVLTAYNDVVYLRRAFAAGASGYLLKEAADIDLVQAVRTVASGRQYVHPTLGAAAMHLETGSEFTAGPGGRLSERELEVLRGIALGHTNAEIARALHVSVRTVETHRRHIQQKLGRSTRAELVERARSAHLLGDDELV
jgi:two-component system, NarL family, response regulator NreC